MFILHRDHFKNGVKIFPVPHALWPKRKPYVDVILRYLTYIDCCKNGKLNLNQYLCLRFLLYLIYNSYVLDQILLINHSSTT